MPEMDKDVLSNSYEDILRKQLNCYGTKSVREETIVGRVVSKMTPLVPAIPGVSQRKKPHSI
jgi:hypothetical protein